MPTETAHCAPPHTTPARLALGPVVCSVLFAIVLGVERNAFAAAAGHTVAGFVMLLAVAWTLADAPRIRRLGELYLWLAFIVSIYYLQLVANRIAAATAWPAIDVFRAVAIVHLVVVAAALTDLLRASPAGDVSHGARVQRLAAALFVAGAVVFWVGARTFPGMTLELVSSNPAGHLWTGVSFLIATAITVAGLALMAMRLDERGDRVVPLVGLLLFIVGSIFWALHLIYRLTVLVEAAEAWKATSVTPDWYEPWRRWAAMLFAVYSILAYAGLAAYGAALLRARLVPRWAGWACIVAGALALPLGGLPLFIHVPLWLVGLALLDAFSAPLARRAPRGLETSRLPRE